MKGMIRWSGLGVAAVFVVLAFFLLEPLLKLVIEQAGTRALSTRVTLDSVSIGWSDSSLSLKGLEVADKAQPMQNKVEVDLIALQINALEALSGHLVSDQATLAGIQFNTPRTSSGAVDDMVTLSNVDEKVGSASDSLSLPGVDLPDMDELVSKENSLTYQRYKALREYIDTNKDAFEQRIEALKDKKKLEDYKARLKEIKKAKGFMGKLEAVSKAKQLKKDIDKDLKEIKRLKKDFNASVAEVKRRVEELKKSPQQEADQILAKVGIEGGTQQVAEMLFGPELKGYLQQLKSFTSSEGKASDTTPEDLQPERGQGIFVAFEEEQKLPLVWFKLAQLSGDFNGLGIPFAFQGEATHLTDQQTLTGKPTAVALDLINDQVKSAKLGVIVDTRTAQKISLDTQITGYQVKDMPLSGDFNLDQGLADVTAKIKLVEDALSGDVSMDMTQVGLTGSGSLFDKYPSAKEALATVNKVDATAVLSGSIDEPGVDITSNLDKVLSNVVNKALEGQIASYKTELTGRLDAMLQEELKDMEGSKSDYLSLSDDIAGTEGLLDNILGGL
ncbi:TIGR03545 family protein [Litoribrevibacter albus]|uniref:TIGR03545 family protein n=1 Tax=Litoribrevibacter albus TaxID=1473156 RepID=A0AA37SB22_9GAMM|nr:TIGR03545 family protein [Litoribrevibacter albus]GLQ31218.1 hypothetical protein GCM10007876_16970 [Litoribrevibacter albus]